jgi:hypothetical protein
MLAICFRHSSCWEEQTFGRCNKVTTKNNFIFAVSPKYFFTGDWLTRWKLERFWRAVYSFLIHFQFQILVKFRRSSKFLRFIFWLSSVSHRLSSTWVF